MSQANPLRIFVTHLWENTDDYLRVFEYLESARNFFYRNYSTPDQPPVGDKETLKEDLRARSRRSRPSSRSRASTRGTRTW